MPRGHAQGSALPRSSKDLAREWRPAQVRLTARAQEAVRDALPGSWSIPHPAPPHPCIPAPSSEGDSREDSGREINETGGAQEMKEDEEGRQRVRGP